MFEGLTKFSRILWPLPSGAYLLWASIFNSDKAYESSSAVNVVLAVTKVVLDPVYLEELKIPLARLIVGLIGFSFLAYLALRDYSEFFPKRFAIHVHFDLPGMIKALGQFSGSEFKTLTIAGQWKKKYVDYFSSLNESLRSEGVNFQFDCSAKNSTTGEGEGIFSVRKARFFASKSVQSYRVVEASGDLKFYSASDRVTKKNPLKTQYSLVGECLVQADLTDLFMWRSVLIHPVFEQSIMPSPTSSARHPTLVTAATKVTLWPFFTYETVYLVEDTEHCFVPVGYAHYIPI